ncbi:MAG: response regulator [Saccharospirillaceae bacterium]|nr:response regulator [Colwellia sp.]NRB77211.1 response regulator [Saccharospirillaceae bacterium]
MMKILYVEDNEDNIYMLSRRLKRKGFEVLIAENGKLGVELCLKEIPDLILMDLSLPVMDGWEAIEVIKNEPSIKHIPIIALSAHAMDQHKQQALDAGANDFDSKPVDLARLMAKITYFIGEIK